MSSSHTTEARQNSGAIRAWLKDQAKAVRQPLALSMAASMVDGLLLLAQAWWLARVIVAVVVDGLGLTPLWSQLFALLAVFSGRALLAPVIDLAAFEAAERVKLDVRLRLHDHLLALGPVTAREYRSGHIAHTLTEAVESLQGYYAGYLPQMARMAFLPLAILVFVFPYDWISGLTLLLTAPLIPLFMILIGKGTEWLNQRQWRRLALLSAHFFDAVEGLTTLKLFGASRREAKVVGQMSEAYRQRTMAVLRVAFLSSLMLEFLATVAIAMVAVFIGFRLYYGEMSFLPGLFILILAPEFYLPLRNMGTQYHARMEAIGAAEQIIHLFAQPRMARPEPGVDRKPAPRIRDIAVERLAFAYASEAPILSDINFRIERGERLALIGPSGSGKSTLSQLLMGFLQPSAGAIRINGTPLTALDPASWLARVAWLGQTPMLFQGSIADNIRLGAPAADMDAMRHAARQANAADFIEALPEAYATRMDARGFSGGELQRIALARAFAKDADLVILDEASASLDRATEDLITAATEKLAQDRAMLVIAHRLSTVQRADRILVLEDGRITASGSHAQLLSSGGYYARMLALYGLTEAADHA